MWFVVVGVIALIFCLFVFLIILVQYLWNSTIPYAVPATRAISFWQTLRLVLLSWILFGMTVAVNFVR